MATRLNRQSTAARLSHARRALARRRPTGLSDQPGGSQVMLMGFNMTVPMVIWMSHRGHSGARNAEMAMMLWRYEDYSRPHA
jgi:hypothetical protein